MGRLILALLLVLAGCEGILRQSTDGAGSDAATSDASTDAPFSDRGRPDVDAAAPNQIAISPLVQDQAGTPISGAHVAIDTDQGRTEGVTGVDGRTDLVVPYDEAQFSWVIATLDHVVRARVDAPLAADELEAGIVLAPLTAAAPSPARLSLTVVGVPTGGTYCVSYTPGEQRCDEAGAGFSRMVDLDQVADRLFAIARKPDGSIDDCQQVELTFEDSLATVSLNFDGSCAVETLVGVLTVTLPPDPMSPLNSSPITGGPGLGYVVRAPDGLIQSSFEDITPSPDGTSLAVAAAHYGALPLTYGLDFMTESGARTQRWFAVSPLDAPAEPVTVLDLPRLSSGGPTMFDAISVTSPPGVERFLFEVFDGEGVRRWSVRASAADVLIPAFPSSFDRGAVYPIPGSSGVLRVSAITGAAADGIVADAEGPEPGMDGQVAQSIAIPTEL